MERRRIILIWMLGAVTLFVGGIFWRYWLWTNDSTQEPQPVAEEHTVAPQTGSTEQGEQEIDTETWTESTQKTIQPEVYTAITLLFPPFVTSDAVASTLAQIAQDYQVEAQRRISDSLESYYKALTTIGKKGSGIDIALVPTDLRTLYETRGYHIPFQDSLSTLYHPLFQNLVDDTNATFLPVRIDPSITIYANELFLSQPQLTLSTLQAALLTSSKEWEVPMSIGLDATTWPVLSWSSEPYFGFGDMLSLFISQAKRTQKEHFLSFFIDSSWRDYGQLLTEIDNCEGVLSFLSCVVANGHLGVWFSWMSDSASIIQASWYTITHFPTPLQDYPVKGRWFIVNKQSPHLKSALQRTKGILTLQHTNWLSAWAPHLLQADYVSLQTQFADQDYASRQPYLTKTQLSTGSNSLENDLLLHKVIQGTYNTEVYLQKK